MNRSNVHELGEGQAKLGEGQFQLQQKEDHDILRALEEASSVHKAETDNLTYAVAEVKGEVKRLNEGQARNRAFFFAIN